MNSPWRLLETRHRGATSASPVALSPRSGVSFGPVTGGGPRLAMASLSTSRTRCHARSGPPSPPLPRRRRTLWQPASCTGSAGPVVVSRSDLSVSGSVVCDRLHRQNIPRSVTIGAALPKVCMANFRFPPAGPADDSPHAKSPPPDRTTYPRRVHGDPVAWAVMPPSQTST